MENWRPIVGYEDTHLISDRGRVYSLLSNKILNPYISNKGYYMVMLNHGRKNRHGKTVHRLVAKAFIENPNHLPIVNHKDENKSNNSVSNLEWCDHKYNNTYGSVRQRIAEKVAKSVYQYDKDYNLINIYQSSSDAARKTGFSRGNIWNACQNPSAVRYNFHWSHTPLV